MDSWIAYTYLRRMIFKRNPVFYTHLDEHKWQKVLIPFLNPCVDIATLGAKITDTTEISNPNVVKIAAGKWQDVEGNKVSRAVYFSRQAIPANAVDFYHHIGIYGYKRQAIEQFVSLDPSYLEITEKLEQLRALEAGMRICLLYTSRCV